MSIPYMFPVGSYDMMISYGIDFDPHFLAAASQAELLQSPAGQCHRPQDCFVPRKKLRVMASQAPVIAVMVCSWINIYFESQTWHHRPLDLLQGPQQN